MWCTPAQDVAEVYEEVVFRRIVASSFIHCDQNPRFPSETFQEFRETMKSRLRATLAYRPQADGQQERSVQTVIKNIRTYIEGPVKGDWYTLAEKLMWARNTSFDATRIETHFFLVHGWDTRNTIMTMFYQVPRNIERKEAYLWRVQTQRQHEYAIAWARQVQIEAKEVRSR